MSVGNADDAAAAGSCFPELGQSVFSGTESLLEAVFKRVPLTAAVWPRQRCIFQCMTPQNGKKSSGFTKYVWLIGSSHIQFDRLGSVSVASQVLL